MGTVREGTELAVFLDSTVLTNPQEDDSVDDALNGEVELPLIKSWVSDGQIASQDISPLLDLLEECVVHSSGTAFPPLGVGVLVERTLENGFLRECREEELPV